MFYNGVQIYETDAAVSKPSGKPHCDDTREMLEHFERLGLIRDVPAVLRVQGKIYMHPILFDKFKRMMRSAETTMQRDLDRAYMWGRI